ncbi:MAG: hypothetical protein ACOYOB_20370 [Myxococcota bacterium]
MNDKHDSPSFNDRRHDNSIFDVMLKHGVDASDAVGNLLFIACPFDPGRVDHRSCGVDLSTEVWRCRTCGRGGNAIDLDVAHSLRDQQASVPDRGGRLPAAVEHASAFSAHARSSQGPDQEADATQLEKLEKVMTDVRWDVSLRAAKGLVMKVWYPRPPMKPW